LTDDVSTARACYKTYATGEVTKEIVTVRHTLRSGPNEVELINQYRLGV